MRPKVQTVIGAARATLLLALGVSGYRLLPSGPWGAGVYWNGWSHAALGYGLTGLVLAAFPRVRRADLIKIVLLAAAVVEVARRFAGCVCGPWDFAADALGVLAVSAPWYIERFRAGGRRARGEPFTLGFVNDRRAHAPNATDDNPFFVPAPRTGR